MSWTMLSRTAASLFLGLALSQADATTENRADLLHNVCFETSDQVQLCYSAHLLDDAPTPILVFIPGWTMPAAIWEKQLAHFFGKYSLVAFDPRGQGASAVPDFGYTLERRVRDIKELLDQFPDRSFVLVGWSLAVFEALAYVGQYGDSRLQGLVLVDNSIGEGPDGPVRTGKNPFFEELRSKRDETLRNFVAAIFRTSPGPLVQNRILKSALQMDVEDSIRLLSYPKPRAYWRETLQKLAKPILYLATPKWGDQAKLLTQKHPRATAKIFEHAGHALFWDEAEQFNFALDDFCKRLNPSNAVRY